MKEIYIENNLKFVYNFIKNNRVDKIESIIEQINIILNIGSNKTLNQQVESYEKKLKSHI